MKIALGPVSGLYHRAVHHWTFFCSWLSTPTRRPCLPNAWSCLLLYLTFLKRCMSRTTPGNRMQSGPPLAEDLFLINSHNSGLYVPPINRFAAVLHGEYVCCCFIYPHLFTESLLLHEYLIVVWDTSVIAPQFPLSVRTEPTSRIRLDDSKPEVPLAPVAWFSSWFPHNIPAQRALRHDSLCAVPPDDCKTITRNTLQSSPQRHICASPTKLATAFQRI